MTGVVVSGLGAFCLLFAINSAIHSYLIVRYANGDKVRARSRPRRSVVRGAAGPPCPLPPSMWCLR
jgi:hypothetical protein